MSYTGDINLGQTFDTKFTTRQISGAPSTLASSPVISCYVGNGTTELTAGITLTVDFDSRTGLNNIRVVATSGNGYATATDNQLVITTGTVNSVSVVGEVVSEFSIENRQSNVKFWNGTAVASPATAGIPDVNVKNMNNVSASAITTIKAVQGLTTADTITTTTTTTNLTNSPTNGDFTATMKTSIGTAVAASAVASVTGNVGGNVTGSVGSVTGLTASNLDATVSSRLATAGYTTPPSVATILTTAITEAYRANGAAPTLAQFMSEVLAHLGEAAIVGTTKTINKLDHSTPAETFTLDSATVPAAITRAT